MNAARDLANTGTPGPWTAILDNLYSVAIVAGDVLQDDVAYDMADADAVKAARAVNALPLVDALCEVIGKRPDPTCAPYVAWVAWSLRVLAARDALDAALRGTS